MSIEQKYCCVFANRHTGKNGSGCQALKEYVCEHSECSFYKPKNKYYLDADGYVHKESEKIELIKSCRW